MSNVLDAPAVPDTPPPLSIHIDMLGGFRLCIAARPVEDRAWRLRKGRSLLKLLALEPGHRLPRDVVLDLLWPDLDPDAAANNLHQTVHAVRRVLGGNRLRPVVLLDRATVSIDPAISVSTDVQAFERAVEAARGSEDITRYEEAVALYAGDLLPDDLYEDWTASRREYLRERFLTVLLDLGALYTARGDTDRAVDTLQRLIAFDPIREDAHAALMRHYAAAGKRQTALRQYSLLREALWRELGVEPDRETEKLYAEILAGSFDRPAPPPPLPVPLTSFIGRTEECESITELLDQSRLVTLVGPGGSGKTRLALAALAGRDAHFADLAPLSEEHAVTDALLAAFSLPNTGDPLDALASAIGTRQVLLLLDNCEHLIAAAAETVAMLLRRCSGLRVLATSREPLNVPGETLFRVPPLSLPPEGRVEVEVLRRSTAVRLFEDRARARDARFRLEAGNAEAVAGICCRLEGAPLAIELAASRIPALPPAEIAARLDDALALLQTHERGAPERHRALRATLDWSYSLLSLPEQRVFAHIGVFAGGFGLAEAERLVEGLVEPRQMLDLLAQMVERSLLIAGTSGEDARFRLSEPVRQYALDTLRRTGEYESARGRHASVYLALAERARPELRGANQPRWMDRLASEHDNLRTALRWLIDRGEKERAGMLAGALWRFWQMRGHGAEGLRWLEAVGAMPGELEPSTHARVLNGLVGLLYRLGDLQRAAVLSDEALTFTRAHGTDNELAVALNNHGTLLLGLRRTNEAIALLEESLALHRSLADSRGIALSLRNLGQGLSITGKYQRALVCYEEVLALRRAQGDTWGTATALGAAALVLYELDQVRRAEELYRESYALAEELGDRSLMAEALIGLALVRLDETDLSGSRNTLEQAMSLLSDLREERTTLWVRNLYGEVLRRQGNLAQAWRHHRPTLGICLAQSYLPEIVEPLLTAVSVAQSLDEHEVGARLLGAIHGLIARLDEHPHRWEREALGELETALGRDLGAERAGEILDEGRALSTDEAVGLALALPD